MDGCVVIKSQKDDGLEAWISETRPIETERSNENTKQVLSHYRPREAADVTNYQQDEARDTIFKWVNLLIQQWLRAVKK